MPNVLYNDFSEKTKGEIEKNDALKSDVDRITINDLGSLKKGNSFY